MMNTLKQSVLPHTISSLWLYTIHMHLPHFDVLEVYKLMRLELGEPISELESPEEVLCS